MLPQGNNQKKLSWNVLHLSLTLPPPHCTTAGDISALAGAPIEELYLRGCYNLTGMSFCQDAVILKCCPRATTKRTFEKIFFIAFLSCTTSGNIEVFWGMPIEMLNLRGCRNLRGEQVEILLLEVSAIMLAGCCPKATH